MPSNEMSTEELQRRCTESPHVLDCVLDLVQRYCDLGRYNDALELCRSAMKHHSREYGFMLEFANVLCRRGDYRESRVVFERLTGIAPERIEAWNNLGMLELSADNPEAANAAFCKVLEIDPQNAGALCNTGNYFAEQGDAKQAAACFERALSLRPGFTEAWYNLGNAYMSLGWFGSAKEAFTKAIHCDGAFGSAYKNLGFVCEQIGEFDQALECYGKAAAQNRTDAGVQVNMAGIYMRYEQYGKALECGKRAASLAPGDPSSWNALRRAAMRLGDGHSYYRAIVALINAIGDDDLAHGITDLRQMGFALEAEELVEYAVKINKGSEPMDALPFVESRAPRLEGSAAANTHIYRGGGSKKSVADGAGH